MKEPSSSRKPVVIAAPAQAFFHLELSPYADTYRLSFSVKEETNIRYYIVEGSYDLVLFDRLTRIHARGNCDMPCTYNATIRNTSYNYYRIRQVDNLTAALFAPSDKMNEPGNPEEDSIVEEAERPYRISSAFSDIFVY
jgi:hypothetical protein